MFDTLPPLVLIVLFVVLLILVDFFRQLFNGWNRAINAPFRPQVVTLPTAATPDQVVRAAAAARLQRRVFCLLILGAVWIVARLYIPEDAMRFENWVLQTLLILGRTIRDLLLLAVEALT